jgi:hypothetical protein
MVNPSREVNLIIPHGFTQRRIWHKWFGHFHKDGLPNDPISSGDWTTPMRLFNKPCVWCLHGKKFCTRFLKATKNKATKILHLIHLDVCGLFQVPSLGGAHYFVNFMTIILGELGCTSWLAKMKFSPSFIFLAKGWNRCSPT